jgi:Domain of unknown function (DUF4166)
VDRAPSVYQLRLGRDFARLQPELQEYFSLAPGSRRYGTGRGVFDMAGCPNALMRPALAAAPKNSFFPDYGSAVPFTVVNFAHRDPFGRPSLTARRTMDFPRGRRVFEDTTCCASRMRLLDYVGSSHRIVTDLEPEVTAAGHLRLVSRRTRFFAGPLRLALPAVVDATASTEQWWDGAAGLFRIRTEVAQPQLGMLFVYAGAFSYGLREYDGGLPPDAAPARWQPRS